MYWNPHTWQKRYIQVYFHMRLHVLTAFDIQMFALHTQVQVY